MRMLRSTLALGAVLALGLTACGTSTPAETADPAPADTTTAAAPVEETTPADETAPAEETTPADEGETTDGDVPQGNGETIYLVSKGFQHRFWQAVKEGAEQAGDEFNYKIEFVGPQAETQVTEQLNMLQTALDTQPAAIGLAALDSGAATPLLDQIAAADIPLVAFDSGVDTDHPLTTVSTDNAAAAGEAAKHMAELIGNEGTVGLICHDETSATGKQRCQGFQDWMAENAPDVTVLTPQVAGEVGLAADTAKSMIQANPELKGIYGTNEAAASGAIQGATESGQDVVVVGFDSGKTQLEAIRDGRQAGAVTQAPVLMGYETVVAAIKALNGQELPKVIDSGYQWYDASNMDDEEIAGNLYE